MGIDESTEKELETCLAHLPRADASEVRKLPRHPDIVADSLHDLR